MGSKKKRIVNKSHKYITVLKYRLQRFITAFKVYASIFIDNT